jgi:hypothetical protein
MSVGFKIFVFTAAFQEEGSWGGGRVPYLSEGREKRHCNGKLNINGQKREGDYGKQDCVK